MNNKSKLATVQTAILIGTALYVVLPDILIGPIDDTVIALFAGIAELVIGFVRARIHEPTPTPDKLEY